MKHFHRKLFEARLAGYSAEMNFWADYAEEKGYRGAERLRAWAAGTSGPPIPITGPARYIPGRRNA